MQINFIRGDMAKEREEEEVFGEGFDLLEGIEDVFHHDDDEEERQEDNDNDDGNSGDNEDEDDEGTDDNEDNEEDTGSEDTQSSSSSPLIPYAKYLKEEGVLPNFDLEKFDGSIDGLREGMYSEILSGVEQYKSTLPEAVKRIIDNYEEGVPLETLFSIDRERARYSQITDEDLLSEDVQKQLVREYLETTTKFSKEKIDKEINRLSDLQELEDEAKAILPELIAIQADAEKQAVEQAKVQREAAEKARVAELESLKDTLKKTQSIVPGVQLSDAMRDKVYKNLITPVAYNEAGQPLNKLGVYRTKNPVQTEIILNYIFEATNEFKDWTVFNKGTKKAVISEIEAAARGLDNNREGRRPSFGSESKKSFLREIDEFLK